MYQVQISKGKGSYKPKGTPSGRGRAVRKYSRVNPAFNARIVDTSTGEIIRRKRSA